MILQELFEPTQLQQSQSLQSAELQRSDAQLWQWQFQVPAATGEPVDFCLRAYNMHRGMFLSAALAQCWAVNFVQAQCAAGMQLSAQTLGSMGRLGNMGLAGATEVFRTAAALLQQLQQHTGAQCVVFNSEPERASLYAGFLGRVARAAGWQRAQLSGSWPVSQNWYIAAATPELMTAVHRQLYDLGQVDQKPSGNW